MSTGTEAITPTGMAEATARVAAIRASLSSLAAPSEASVPGSSSASFGSALADAVASFSTAAPASTTALPGIGVLRPRDVGLPPAARAGAGPTTAVSGASGVSGPNPAGGAIGAGAATDRWVSPVRGRVTSPFGMRVHPITGVRKLHTGTDFAAVAGTPVGAASAGTVVSAGWEAGNGNVVVIDHGGGVTTKYAHASRLLVRPGDRVDTGEAVIQVGSTGLATGPHLHLEVRQNDEPVDPIPWLRARGVNV